MGSENKICFLFQSTHPRRVWQVLLSSSGGSSSFQSTHLRRVWQIVLIVVRLRVLVSIHTPTKGVTQDFCDYYKYLKFQSTHPRRVWHAEAMIYYHHPKFQSTHPRRVWHAQGCIDTFSSCVSIHTPTKGVTLVSEIIYGTPWFQSTHPRRVWHRLPLPSGRTDSFNPHTHEGCDMVSTIGISPRLSFNPHTHEGCDGVSKGIHIHRECFNPHTHEGCDLGSSDYHTQITVSIHTPTKGVTSKFNL